MANGRCRMHGGKSTGPRTAAGIARMTAANTTHGKNAAAGAPKRALQRYTRTLIIRTRLLCEARRLWPYLPPDMAARLATAHEDLGAPVHPSNLPFLPPEAATLYTLQPPAPAKSRRPRAVQPDAAPLAPRARDAERRAARQESAALAPWHAAIAAARAAKRATRRAARAVKRAARAAKPAAHRAAIPQSPPSRSDPVHPSPSPERPAPHALARDATAPARPAVPPHPALASPSPNRVPPAATPGTLAPAPATRTTRVPTPAPTVHRPATTTPATPDLTHRTPTKNPRPGHNDAGKALEPAGHPRDPHRPVCPRRAPRPAHAVTAPAAPIGLCPQRPHAPYGGHPALTPPGHTQVAPNRTPSAATPCTLRRPTRHARPRLQGGALTPLPCGVPLGAREFARCSSSGPTLPT